MRTLLLSLALGLAASTAQAQNPYAVTQALQAQYDVANRAAYWRYTPVYPAYPAYYGYGYARPSRAYYQSERNYELRRIRQSMEMQELRQSWSQLNRRW